MPRRLITLAPVLGGASLRVGPLTLCVYWPLFRRPTWLAPFWHLGHAGGTWIVRAGPLAVVWMGRRRP